MQTRSRYDRNYRELPNGGLFSMNWHLNALVGVRCVVNGGIQSGKRLPLRLLFESDKQECPSSNLNISKLHCSLARGHRGDGSDDFVDGFSTLTSIMPTQTFQQQVQILIQPISDRFGG